MRKISRANTSFMESYQRCVSGIIEQESRDMYMSYSAELEAMTNSYIEKALLGELYQLPHQGRIRDESIIVRELTKGHMTKLYSYYMVGKDAGRYIYDLILTTAKNVCPYCGGIGFATTLDHYLPKSIFPQFAVSPENLIPACKDCNVEKKDTVVQNYHEQPFHPFYDDEFDVVEWIDAEIISISPLVLNFFANPPELWSPEFRARALNHFEKFKLAIRYSVMAADEIEIIKHLRRNVLRDVPDELFRNYLLDVSTSMGFVNGYKAVLYRRLSRSDEIIYERDWLD
ncbi:HNH endonuclease [Pantoea dispersa]|uniref:HNH endonuclease n=1 Tax=Pantoea dispersa TaxID=59814 RepID=UPI0035281787